MVREDVSLRDLEPFQVPSAEDCERVGVFGIHLGDYIFWDDERQTEFVRDNYGWKRDAGRRQLQALQERRMHHARRARPGLLHQAGLRPRHLPRQRGRACRPAEPRRSLGPDPPDTDGVRPEGLDYYLKITGMSEEEFFATLEKHRRPELKNTVIPIYPKPARTRKNCCPYPQQLQRKFGTLT